MKMAIRLAAVLTVLALAIPTDAQAAPSYFLNHNADAYGNTGPIESAGPQATPIDYDFEYQQTYFLANSNFGEVHANIDPGSIGIYALTDNKGVGAGQRQEVSASFDFDVVFSSPTSDPISTSLNLDLSGVVNPAFGALGGIQVLAGTTSMYGSGAYSENPQPGIVVSEDMLAGFVDDGTVNSVSTPVLNNIPVNTIVRFKIELDTFLTYGPGVQSTIEFGSTFSLTTSGDVFTILGPNAGDISVDSEDAGIVNNRYGQVPEPSSLVLLCLGVPGLLMLWWTKNRKSLGGPRSIARSMFGRTAASSAVAGSITEAIDRSIGFATSLRKQWFRQRQFLSDRCS